MLEWQVSVAVVSEANDLVYTLIRRAMNINNLSQLSTHTLTKRALNKKTREHYLFAPFQEVHFVA